MSVENARLLESFKIVSRWAEEYFPNRFGHSLANLLNICRSIAEQPTDLIESHSQAARLQQLKEDIALRLEEAAVVVE
jgi:hypothetical protein